MHPTFSRCGRGTFLAALLVALSLLTDWTLQQSAGRPAGDEPVKDPSKVKIAARYANRTGEERAKAVQQFGGSKASEAAVEKGLDWLALHQAPDGSWSLEKFSEHARKQFDDKEYFNDKSTGKGQRNDTAGAAFGLLPFLARGITDRPSGVVEDDRYVKTVKNGLNYLMQNQGKAGDFPGGMYAHPLATIALCEAYALTGDPMLKKPAQTAIDYIIAAQDLKGGGWRYQPRQGSDTSVTGWHLQALKAAQSAGLNVPNAALKRAELWIASCESPDGGGYGYTGPTETPTMTAVGLLCRMELGTPRRNPNLLKGVEKLHTNAGPAAQRNAYCDYYATQAFHHMGGEYWDFWNNGPAQKKGMRDILIARQDKDGSWDPRGDVHCAGAGGRIMQTSLSLLTLEVYYRHTPLFRPLIQKKDK